MNATLVFLHTLALMRGNLDGVEAIDYVSQGTCTPQQQRNILSAVTSCQARDTLINLRQHMPNTSNIIQVKNIQDLNRTRLYAQTPTKALD